MAPWWSPRTLFRMGLQWTLALVSSYLKLCLRIILRCSTIYPRCPPVCHSARACIVTGASSGVGAATAEVLALEGYHVIMAGRSLSRLSKVISELRKKHDDLLLYPMELDLCSVASIESFVENVECWLSEQQSLQLLVNNAGILAAHQSNNSDGYDRTVMTNYLGPFILTRLLLSLLRKSSHPPRIVNVVSFTHRCARSLEIGSLLTRRKPSSSDRSYNMAETYEASKLSLLLFTYELHRRLWQAGQHPRISVMAADPGVVQTKIMRELPWWLVQFTFMVLKGLFLLQSPPGGARSVVDAALAPTEASGLHFFGGYGFTLPSSKLSRDEKLAAKLWLSSSRAFEQVVEGRVLLSAGSNW